MVSDAVAGGCVYEETDTRYLGFYWVGVGHRMCLRGLGSREPGPLVRNPHTSPGPLRAEALVVKDVRNRYVYSR